ncbi:Ribosomal protein L3 N(5)-glutamine methyltransferase [hydrothermal vent metagenome]|uniref:Ribosomal protein L3 N(5)-glutamine methyltransferase n=1 Tax=hydrothermal vent metagenome TaxID=652676 RepID=A0A3B0YMN1_9ZZZZ
MSVISIYYEDMMSGQSITIRKAVELAAQELDQQGVYFGHGTDNAFDEALSLVLYVLGLDYTISNDALDASVSVLDLEKIREIIGLRISSRTPAPYLTHRTWFMGLELYVDERVLVPRSPLAELIYEQYRPWLVKRSGLKILDLCTGGGCIAIASAVAIEDSLVVAADISEQALEVCRKNIDKHDLQHRIESIQSDLFSNLGQQKFDLIVTNPPYVPQQARQELPQEYLHEPDIGLYSGETGLDIPLKILRHAQQYLNEGGILIMEVGESQQRLMETVPELAMTWLEFEYGGEGVCVVEQKDLLHDF